MSNVALWRRLLAELLGSAFLAAVVIGSGIAAQRLSPGDTGLNCWRTQRRPLRAVRDHLDVRPSVGRSLQPGGVVRGRRVRGLRWRDAAAYLPVQVAGCIGGAVIANLMFALPAVSISTKDQPPRPTSCRDRRHPRADPGDLRAGPVRT
jgi:arsenate reductase